MSKHKTSSRTLGKGFRVRGSGFSFQDVASAPSGGRSNVASGLRTGRRVRDSVTRCLGASLPRCLLRLKQMVLLMLCLGLCTGLDCTINISGDGLGGFGTDSYVALDEAHAVITINQSNDATEAKVGARITNQYGFTVQLEEGQDVSINGQSLSGPDTDGYYRGNIPVANEYTVTVTEPERGVLETTITSPGGFQITSPTAGGDASLSGFTVSWPNADANLNVTIALRQTLFGQTTTEEFGPQADSGSYTFNHEDLIDFRQGADLLIAVVRTKEQQSIAGFSTGTLSLKHAATATSTPTP